MIDLGKVNPGSTIRIPFGSYAGSTGASSATTNLAAADVLIFKDGSATERASTAGITVTADFDTRTGLNLIEINLGDNTTAGFYAAGSEYIVMIGDVTIDTQTVRFPLARFRIGYPQAMIDTTIASLSSQTSFTLAAGPAEDDALNGCWAIIHDVASAVQLAMARIDDYTGSTKTVTLAAGASFTAAASDNISILPKTAPTVADIVQTALAESYRADGATGSIVQMLYEIVARLGESSISGTTMTTKRIDGSTTAATYTLDSATTPTSITRAS